MSLPSVGSNQARTIGSTLLQQLAAEESSSQSTSGDSGILGDLMSLSPAAAAYPGTGCRDPGHG